MQSVGRLMLAMLEQSSAQTSLELMAKLTFSTEPLKKQILNTNLDVIVKMIDRVMFGLGIIAVAFIIYKILYQKRSYKDDIEKELDEVISSDKYKVKGQYD